MHASGSGLRTDFKYPPCAERIGARDCAALSVAIKTLNAGLVKSFGLQKLVKKPVVAHTYVILTI
jgi:hypothetical protein